MSSFDDFKIDLTRAAANLIAAMPIDDHVSVRYSLGGLLGHHDENQPPKIRELNPNEKFIEQLFFKFSGVFESVESLRNVPVYISRFPYSRSGVDKTAYLRYHIENYLNELYILQNRMKILLTYVSRRYKKDHRGDQIKIISEKIQEDFVYALSNIVSTRGAHVHERRYDDYDLSRLTLFNILSSESDYYAIEYEKIYRQVRRLKRLWIETTNKSIEQLLDTCFGKLKILLFDNHGHLEVPNKLPNESLAADARSSRG